MTAPSDYPDHLSLAADFPHTTRDDWRELVGAVLRKSAAPGSHPDEIDPELALSSTTYDGIRLSPLYTAEDVDADVTLPGLPGRPPFVRGAASAAAVDSAALGWDVRQRHGGPDAALVNTAILADLDNGVSSLWLAVGGPVGVPVERLDAALAGVYLELAPIALDAGADTERAARTLLDLATQRGVGAELIGTLGADPIGLRASTGAAADLSLLGRLAALLEGRPGLRVATVDAAIYHNAGGSDSDELAIAAAVGVAYLRALTDAGLSVDDALARIEFRYAVGADQFGSIAKLRAARRIWDRIAELAGAAPAARGQRQHAVTSAAMMTRRDPWVNILRGTIACFAAAIGGAEAITVAPFDSAIGLPDDFGRRIARNTQSILHDESSLARVLDAAGGSFYVESLTEQLAAVAWELFTGIERDGGALTALDSGALGSRLAASYERRRANVATRRDAITGVSEFALITEEPLVRTPVPASSGGLLPRIRYAEDFERLRDRSDAHLAAHGSRPVVFLAALGPLTAHAGRLAFASNLFQAAGLEPVVGTGDAGELAVAWRASGTGAACLCSSERVYADSAAPVAVALKEAGVARLWLAGQPGERIGSDAAAGVDGYVFGGCDALAVLAQALDAAGVQA